MIIGIIANAQKASILQSCADLEEFFNEYYVSNYEKWGDTQDIILAMENENDARQWFHIPKNDGIGNLNYVVDSDGNCLFLIKKSGLPDYIKQSIVGGEAGGESYASYSALDDVYGITNRLNVYYCKSSTEFIGIASKAELDKDNPLREVFSSTKDAGTYSLLSTYDKKDENGNSDGILTAEELRTVTDINLNNSISVSTIRDLTLLPNLTTLTLNNIALDSLDGIENLIKLTSLTITNYGTDGDRIKDYSKLKYATKLQTLNIGNTSNSQIEKIFSAMSGVDYPLTTLKVYSSSNVNDISSLSNLSINTQKKVTTLTLSDTQISTIECLENFSSVTTLSIQATDLKTLKGVKNMTKLKELYAHACNLGNDEIYNTNLENNGMDSSRDALADLENISTLETVYLYSNDNLKWISYISNNSGITSLNCNNNTNLVKSDVAKMKNIYNNLTTRNSAFHSKYLALFNSDEMADYMGYEENLTNDSDEILALLNNTEIKYLRLDGNTNLGNNIEGTSNDLSDILATCTSMISLSLRDLTLLNDIDFVSSMPNLKVLDIWGCSGITDLSILDTQTKEGKLNLTTLRLNNSELDLTVCQKTIDGLLTGDVVKYMFGDSGSECRGFCASVEVYRNLNLCKELTTLRLTYRKSWGNYKIDLSGCSSLKTVAVSHCGMYFMFPSSLEDLTLAHYSAQRVSDLSRCQKLTSVVLREVYNIYPINEWIAELGKCSKLQKIEISTYSCNQTLDFENLANCSELTSFELVNFNGSYVSGSSQIINLDKASSLTSITFRGITITNTNFSLPIGCITAKFNSCKLEDIPIISQEATALRTLELSNNKITSLRRLEGINSIRTLNLNTNLLEDTYTYTLNGETFSPKTCQTILDLKNNGSLTSIQIKNDGITDYSLLKLSGWNDTTKSGW